MNLFNTIKPEIIIINSFLDKYRSLYNNTNKSIIRNQPDYVNRCFEGDLIIEFPLSESQIKLFNRTNEALSNLIYDGDMKNSNNNQTNDFSFINIKYKTVVSKKSIQQILDLVHNLTDFQKEQIKKSINNIVRSLGPDMVVQMNFDHVLRSIIINNVNVFCNYFVDYLNAGVSLSLRQIMDYDRSGYIFKILRNFLKTNESISYPCSYFNIKVESIDGIALGKYNENNDLVIINISYDKHFKLVKKQHTYGYNDFRYESYQTNNDIEANQLLTKLYKDYKESKNFEHLSELIPKKKYNIPSLKRICYSVLYETFLVNKEEFEQKIIVLPTDTLQDFLIYCSKINRPVGFEIIQYVSELLGSILSQKEIDLIFPLQLIVESLINHHTWFQKAYESDMPRNLFSPSYNENLLIDVYENTHIFKHKPIPKGNLLIQQTAYSTPLQLKDYNQFLENFRTNTSGFFDNLPEEIWDHMVVMGGIVTSSLIGSTVGYETSDIDIYFYGLEDTKDSKIGDQISNILIFDMLESFGDNPVTITRTSTRYTFSRHHPYRHIQVSLEIFDSIQELLLGTDIEASCFAYDGKRVWTTQRGVQSFNYQANFATPYGHGIRGEMTYQRRLLKYVERGFNIVYLPTEEIEKSLERIDWNSQYCHGLEVLYRASKDIDFYNLLIKYNKDHELPFGTHVDEERFRNEVTFSFDEYTSNRFPTKPYMVTELESVTAKRPHYPCVFDFYQTYCEVYYDVFYDFPDFNGPIHNEYYDIRKQLTETVIDKDIYK